MFSNMKATTAAALVCTLALGLVATPSALAQRQLGRKKNPTAKVYVAEVKGESKLVAGEKVFAARQATAFDAPGTIIETGSDAHNAFVYSNGTGMFVDENTRVEIDRFVQEPFQAQPEPAGAQAGSGGQGGPSGAGGGAQGGSGYRSYSTEIEPSISQSEVVVSHGFVGICTSQMLSGSSMTYSTPHASVNIRGKKVGIRAAPQETTIYLLEGDITVRTGNRDPGGHVLRSGEQAVVRPGLIGQAPSVTISPIPPEMMQSVDDRVTVACNARKTVTFDMIERRAEAGPAGTSDLAAGFSDEEADEIVATPTVPAEQPNNIVVSQDRLPGGS